MLRKQFLIAGVLGFASLLLFGCGDSGPAKSYKPTPDDKKFNPGKKPKRHEQLTHATMTPISNQVTRATALNAALFSVCKIREFFWEVTEILRVIKPPQEGLNFEDLKVYQSELGHAYAKILVGLLTSNAGRQVCGGNANLKDTYHIAKEYWLLHLMSIPLTTRDETTVAVREILISELKKTVRAYYKDDSKLPILGEALTKLSIPYQEVGLSESDRDEIIAIYRSQS